MNAQMRNISRKTKIHLCLNKLSNNLFEGEAGTSHQLVGLLRDLSHNSFHMRLLF